MNEIKFDKRNYRKHDKKNKSLIKKSLEKFGAGRSIVVDAEGEIIAGNGVYEQAQKLGLKTKIVKIHQNVLVFYKGNPKEIKNIFPALAVKESYAD